MNLKYSILFFLFAVIAVIPKTMGNDCIYFQLKSGEVVNFELGSRPTIRFENDLVTVCNRNFSFNEIAYYTFNEGLLGGISSEISDVWLVRENGKVIIPIPTSTGAISVVNMQGFAMPANITEDAGAVCIDFSNVPSGIYILTAGSRSLKICKQ